MNIQRYNPPPCVGMHADRAGNYVGYEYHRAEVRDLRNVIRDRDLVVDRRGDLLREVLQLGPTPDCHFGGDYHDTGLGRFPANDCLVCKITTELSRKKEQ